MGRIFYIHLANPGLAGGQKVALRHVEALNELGFDAACYADPGVELPSWFEHQAPVVRGEPIRPDDVVVVPEDGIQALRVVAAWPARRLVVLCQNPYYLATTGLEFIAGNAGRFSTLMTVGPRHAALTRRLFPQATVEMVRCFADERLFQPRDKAPLIACAPRKRRLEVVAIRQLHRGLHPRQADVDWATLEGVAEAQMAEALGGAGVFLSLSRLESVGMTTLEAMASGCVCAGFTGVGGGEYATADNGLWVPEDDCVAAADALAEAVDLHLAGGSRRARMIEAGLETARAWSHAVFRRELEEVWERLAPDARRR